MTCLAALKFELKRGRKHRIRLPLKKFPLLRVMENQYNHGVAVVCSLSAHPDHFSRLSIKQFFRLGASMRPTINRINQAPLW
jgi:hypothetical protein